MDQPNEKQLDEAALEHVAGGSGSPVLGYFRCSRCHWRYGGMHHSEQTPPNCPHCGTTDYMEFVPTETC